MAVFTHDVSCNRFRKSMLHHRNGGAADGMSVSEVSETLTRRADLLDTFPGFVLLISQVAQRRRRVGAERLGAVETSTRAVLVPRHALAIPLAALLVIGVLVPVALCAGKRPRNLTAFVFTDLIHCISFLKGCCVRRLFPTSTLYPTPEHKYCK